MKTKFVVLLLFVGNVALAARPLSINCEVIVSGEQTLDIENKSVSFDADEGYKSLKLNVYDAKLTVGATFTMSQDGLICAHKIQGFCVELKGSSICSSQPEVRLYSKDRLAQVGDYTEIKCVLVGGEPFACPVEP